MSLAALWAGAALAITVPEPRVTFEHRAARVERLFPTLSKAAGVNLTFSPQTKDEVLIVCVKDAPLGELRAKIAEAASAEWQAEEGGFRLIRSAKLLQKLEDEHLDRMAASIRTAQERLAKQLASKGEYSDAVAIAMAEQLNTYIAELQGHNEPREQEFRRADAMRSGLPGWRLSVRIAALIDPRVLASIPEGESRVFSTAPNRMQLPFPKSVASAMTTYAQEAAQLARVLPREPKIPEAGLESNVFQAINLVKRAQFVPAKILLRVRSPQPWGNAYLQLSVADAEGKVFDRSYSNLSRTDPAEAPPIPPANAPAPNEKPIALSALAQEFATYVGRAYSPSNSAHAAASPALRQYLRNPEDNEISGLLLSDQALGAAKGLGLNLVFSPSYTLYAPVGGGDLTPTGFLNRLAASRIVSLTLNRQGEWLVVRPTDWVQNRDATPDRQALGRFVREGERRKLGLDDFATLAVSSSCESAYNTALQYCRLALPQALDRFQDSNYTLLQLHGSLNPFQRQTLADGRAIPAGNLTPWQQARLAKLVFNQRDFTMQYDYDRASQIPGQGSINYYETLMSESTECYPDGVPPQAQLSIKDLSQSRIRCMKREGGELRQYMETSPEGYAQQLFGKERPDVFRGFDDFPYNEFALIDKTEIQYELRSPQLMYHQGTIEFTHSASEAVKSFDALPESIRNQVQTQLAKLRERFKNVKPPGR